MQIWMLKLNMIAYALNSVFTPWGSAISRFPGYITIITTILLPFSGIEKEFIVGIRKETKAFLCLGFVAAASLALSLLDTQIDQEYILAFLGFICVYATLSADTITYSEKDLKLLFTVNKVLCLSYIIYTFSALPIIKYTVYDNWGNTHFTLGFSNPNTTGAYVMFSVAMLTIQLSYERKWQYKVWNILLAIVLSYIIYLTECRTALICSCLFILIALMKHIPLKSWYVDIALTLMIAFIAIQIWLGQGDIVFLGKNFASGRQNMYASFIDNITKNPWAFILGNSGTYRLENAHNAAFAIVQNFGFLGLGCFLGLWRVIIKKSIISANCNVNRMAIFILLVYIIYSSTEAAILIGMIPHGTPILVIGRLAKDHYHFKNCVRYSKERQ